MNTTHQALCTLLQCFVNEKPLDLPADTDWMALRALAQMHSVETVAEYMLLQKPPESVKDLIPVLWSELKQKVGAMSQKIAGMDRLVHEMNQAGLDHLLMKGYVVRGYYPIPKLRSFGDIDFLIRPEDRARSNSLMQHLGYTMKDDWEPVYSFERGTEYYEIHSHVMEIPVSDKADYIGYFSDLWAHARPSRKPGYEHTYLLEPEYHLIYLLAHMAKHIKGAGAGIRMYLDIAVFTKRFSNTLDWQAVKQQLEILCFEDFANVVFTIVEKVFGVPSPIELRAIDADVFDAIMVQIMNGGLFGMWDKKPADVWMKRDDQANLQHVSKMKTFLHRLFPAAKQIEKRYTYLQGRHYLLPVAWVHRLFKTRSSLNQHMQEAISIANADEKNILLLRKADREFGL